MPTDKKLTVESGDLTDEEILEEQWYPLDPPQPSPAFKTAQEFIADFTSRAVAQGMPEYLAVELAHREAAKWSGRGGLQPGGPPASPQLTYASAYPYDPDTPGEWEWASARAGLQGNTIKAKRSAEAAAMRRDALKAAERGAERGTALEARPASFEEMRNNAAKRAWTDHTKTGEPVLDALNAPEREIVRQTLEPMQQPRVPYEEPRNLLDEK